MSCLFARMILFVILHKVDVRKGASDMQVLSHEISHALESSMWFMTCYIHSCSATVLNTVTGRGDVPRTHIQVDTLVQGGVWSQPSANKTQGACVPS
jgi:hypothetical protein